MKGATLRKTAGVLVVVAFMLFALLPFASELVGAYWPELGRRLCCSFNGG